MVEVSSITPETEDERQARFYFNLSAAAKLATLAGVFGTGIALAQATDSPPETAFTYVSCASAPDQKKIELKIPEGATAGVEINPATGGSNEKIVLKNTDDEPLDVELEEGQSVQLNKAFMGHEGVIPLQSADVSILSVPIFDEFEHVYVTIDCR